jgi:hypothetical protein
LDRRDADRLRRYSDDRDPLRRLTPEPKTRSDECSAPPAVLDLPEVGVESTAQVRESIFCFY